MSDEVLECLTCEQVWKPKYYPGAHCPECDGLNIRPAETESCDECEKLRAEIADLRQRLDSICKTTKIRKGDWE